MDSAHRPVAIRSAGMLSARILMALAAIAAAFTLTVVGAEPASAGTIEVSPDQILYRSDRLHSNQVHATVIITLRSNGDWTVRIEANNSGPTARYVVAGGRVYSPAAEAGAGHWSHCWRVGRGHHNYEVSGWDAKLESRWDQVVNDPGTFGEASHVAYRTFC